MKKVMTLFSILVFAASLAMAQTTTMVAGVNQDLYVNGDLHITPMLPMALTAPPVPVSMYIPGQPGLGLVTLHYALQYEVPGRGTSKLGPDAGVINLSPSNSVIMVVGPSPYGHIVRVWRGSTAGVYDGYYAATGDWYGDVGTNVLITTGSTNATMTLTPPRIWLGYTSYIEHDFPNILMLVYYQAGAWHTNAIIQ